MQHNTVAGLQNCCRIDGFSIHRLGALQPGLRVRRFEIRQNSYLLCMVCSLLIMAAPNAGRLAKWKNFAIKNLCLLNNTLFCVFGVGGGDKIF